METVAHGGFTGGLPSTGTCGGWRVGNMSKGGFLEAKRGEIMYRRRAKILGVRRHCRFGRRRTDGDEIGKIHRRN
jgi:hypothetical protein